MNILEELWYGNIEPAEYDASPGKAYILSVLPLTEVAKRYKEDKPKI